MRLAQVKPSFWAPFEYHVVENASFRSAYSVSHTLREVLIGEVPFEVYQ